MTGRLGAVAMTLLVACGDDGSASAGSTTDVSTTSDAASTSTSGATTSAPLDETTADLPTTTAPHGTTTDVAPTTATTGTSSDDTTAPVDTSTTAPADTTTTADTTGDGPVCGDGDLDPGEACDDGNLIDGDGCESCQVVPVTCGNGVLDPGEGCDDGNGDADDGCGAGCASECGFLCLDVGQPCIPGFHAVQCASPGAPFGQPSPIANDCRLATLSVDGDHIALSPGTTIAGEPRHLDAMYTDPNNAVFGFAGDTEDLAPGSRLVAVDTATGALTPIGPNLGVWVMGAAMNDEAELWVTVFATYERNETTEVSIAQVDPLSGEFIDGPTLLTEEGMPLTVWSTHVSDVAFRFDGTMFISANEPGPPPPEPLSRYLEVDRDTATVLSAVDGPDDLYAAGIVFVGEADKIIAMDIRGADDIFVLDLSAPPTLDETLLYPDPIPTNSGTADLAGCSKLVPQ